PELVKLGCRRLGLAVGGASTLALAGVLALATVVAGLAAALALAGILSLTGVLFDFVVRLAGDEVAARGLAGRRRSQASHRTTDEPRDGRGHNQCFRRNFHDLDLLDS